MAGTKHSWPRATRTLDERFWEKVAWDVPEGKCWEWLGTKQPRRSKGGHGYGAFTMPGRMVAAHRMSYELCVGAVPAGLYVRHLCNNPSCVNPEHLAVGTQKKNMEDREEAGNHRKGEASVRARLNNEQVAWAREQRSLGVKLKDLAVQLGVHAAHLSRVVNGKRWAHVA